MSFILALLCLAVACVTAAPTPAAVVPLEKEQLTVIPILSQFEELEANGTYKFSYETGNGIKREETSYDKILPQVEARSGGDEDSESVHTNEIHVQQGSYSYIAPDGTVISLRYIADENGFRPVGDHLPTPPPFIQHQVKVANEKTGRALKVNNAASAELSSYAPIVVEEKVKTNVAAVQTDNKPKEASKEITAEVEKKPEIAAIELAIAASPSIKDSDAINPIQDISFAEKASTTVSVESAAKESVLTTTPLSLEAEASKAPKESPISESTSSANPPPDVKIVSEEKSVSEAPSPNTSAEPISSPTET